MRKWLTYICLTLLIIGCRRAIITSGNPLFKGNYADPEVAVLNKQYWIFPTTSVDYKEGVYFDAFTSTDLVHWKKHKRVLDSSMIKWVRKALWAPAMVEKDGKFYFFFSANDIQCPTSPWWKPELINESQYGGIGIAVANHPEGPYKDYLGKPLVSDFYNNAQPIDQFIFKEKTGKYYMIYGGWKHCNITQLNNDFTSLIPFSDGSIVKEITPQGYVEGSVMFYRKNKVYFMWSEGDWTNSTYKVAYSIADTPLGPFKRIGTVIEQDSTIATGAGHNSVLNIPGTDDWYIVYHRRPALSTDRNNRVTCMDHLYFNNDGTIKPVKMTVGGVEKKLFN